MGDPSFDPLSHYLPLTLCKGSKQVQHQLSSRGGEISLLMQTHEGDSERSEFIERQDHVLQAPRQPIHAPHEHGIHLSTATRRDQPIQRRPVNLSSGDPLIDIFFLDRPFSGLDVDSPLPQLEIHILSFVQR